MSWLRRSAGLNLRGRPRCVHSCATFMRVMSAPCRSPARRRWPPRDSILQPGLLEVAQHQAAYPTQRIRIGRMQRGIAPQQPPALAEQDLSQGLHIAVDRLDIGITAVEQDFQVAIGSAETMV